MKPPSMKITIKPMAIPAGRALKAGRAILSAFAHHPPAQEEPERMKRPHGGRGPRNPGEA
jgi:hypothetical protein